MSNMFVNANIHPKWQLEIVPTPSLHVCIIWPNVFKELPVNSKESSSCGWRPANTWWWPQYTRSRILLMAQTWKYWKWLLNWNTKNRCSDDKGSALLDYCVIQVMYKFGTVQTPPLVSHFTLFPWSASPYIPLATNPIEIQCPIPPFPRTCGLSCFPIIPTSTPPMDVFPLWEDSIMCSTYIPMHISTIC